ncbi:CoA ester lyase [Mycolicibacterium sp. P9-64]|uniref:HpcH/HpaI aldolase/citrate lyase family protein n=1 Tax=Mycolicibacterium sp. P9-64 TaxID=2024612 RepID=UPI0011EDFE6A|nr:CoA ester lyase [Mycolicibacterium sp. P9-64]KAA0085600.1 CoA ester lyase [Mycolicibacterium sp. P9-64]
MAGSAVTSVPDRRRRRSLLVFPATELRMARKAAASNADCVIFDLEDAVTLDKKSQARAVLEEALAEIDFGGKEICVRINSVNSAEFADDVNVVNRLPIHAVVVPKVETSDDVRTVDAALSGNPGPTLHLAVESPRGLLDCRDFAQASPRVAALLFGSGDFVAASGFSSDESALAVPRSLLSLAASSLGIDALDLVFGNVADLDGLGRSAAAGRALGYSGKWVIHPGQVNTVNDAFTPNADEVERAHRTLAAMSQAQEQGKGAATLDGVLIDEASIRWAEVVVARSAPTVT